MTPLEIEIMLHYRCTPTDYRGGDFSAPVVREAIDKFKSPVGTWTVSGMLEEVPREEVKEAIYRITEKGRIYVGALCCVPIPVQTWVMPDRVENGN